MGRCPRLPLPIGWMCNVPVGGAIDGQTYLFSARDELGDDYSLDTARRCVVCEVLIPTRQLLSEGN
jgi:hypothetical protein